MGPGKHDQSQDKSKELLQGTLDMLILKAVSLGAAAWVRRPVADSADFGGGAHCAAGIAVSGVVLAGAPGGNCERVGREREQPAREVLSADQAGPGATRRGNRKVEADVGDH